MRKAAMLLICAMAIVLFVGVSLIESLMVIQRIATVSNVHGVVKVRPHGRMAFVGLGETKRVLSGDVLQTGPDGGLTLTWVDNSRIRVGPSTTMQVLKCQVNRARQSETYLFRLDVGQIWVRVLKVLSQTSKFEVATPTATAAVRGTVFSVAVSPAGTTRVSVLKGSVALKGTDTEVAVGERQVAAVGGARATAAAPLASAEQRAWEQAGDVARPTLTVTAPADERLAAGATAVPVRGIAEVGAQVTVNGRPVPAGVRGRFEARVPVPTGAETLTVTVRAVDRKGFDAVVEKHLRR